MLSPLPDAVRPAPARRSRPMIGLRAALVAVIVASLSLCAVLLHLTWLRTATDVSRGLVDALEVQITDAVTRAWWGVVTDVQSRTRSLRDALPAAGDAAGRERVLTATVLSASNLSWLIDVPPEGGIMAYRDEAPARLRYYRADRDGRVEKIADIALSTTVPDGAAMASGPRETRLAIRGEPWLSEARAAGDPGWFAVPATPDGREKAVAYVATSGEAVLAAMIGYRRFAALLGDIPVGRTGRSYVLAADGAIEIASDAPRAPRRATLDPVALAAGRIVAARAEAARNVPERTRVVVEGAGYAVALSPLWFRGWQLAVIVPEAEFLGGIDDTIRRVALGVAFLVLATSLVGILAVQRLVVSPIGRLVGDLARVERLDLDGVAHRPSMLTEIDRLSRATSQVGTGLSNFAKFIPTDLVRTLVAEGVPAEPGGSRRELTVLFADLAGFTALSERLGDGIVPVVSAFLDLASRTVAAESGTVDKYIGDAVMAFWGAPRDDPDQVANACRAALALERGTRALPLPPGLRDGLRVRIGIHTGSAIVGNVGSANRLNYTALGDAVNLASRFEGVNKVYGTAVLIGEATRAALGPGFAVREVDRVVVYGRAEAVALYELVGAGEAPAWVAPYEEALALYRARDFARALAALDRLAALRPGDGPGARLAALCRRLAAEPPPGDWRPVTVLDGK